MITVNELQPMIDRADIADKLIKLAESIAHMCYSDGILIESLADEMLPEIKNDGISANVQETIEGWAYTYLDYLTGGIKKDELNSADARRALLGLPLENHYMGEL